MLLQFKDLTIRNATVEDAWQLAKWWNNGSIMAHAGFPKGLGKTIEEVAGSIQEDRDDSHRHLIIVKGETPIGEMNYRNMGEAVAQIGIKICDFSLHDQGIGTVLLSMLIFSLFHDMGYEKIVLDTNLNNTRAQHVYEKLGFHKVAVRENSWRDQLGQLQSSVEYEMRLKDFVNCAE